MNSKIQKTVDAQYDELCRDCFAHWITSLWGKYDEAFTFEENKDAFFYLLERLLREGRVTFDHPEKPVLWGETSEVMLNYFKDNWPHGVTTEDDIQLTIYFYRMPPIAWRGPDGEWHGS